MRRISLCVLLLTTFLLPLRASAEILNGPLTLLGPLNHCSSTWGSDTYACTIPNIPAGLTFSYLTDTPYQFTADVGNTGGATINLNGAGARTIVKARGGITTGLITGDIQAGQRVLLVYDGTNMQCQNCENSATSSAVGDTLMARNAQSDTAVRNITVSGVINGCSSATGTDSYACNQVPALTVYTTNACHKFVADVPNEGPASINFNDLGAVAILKHVDGNLVALVGEEITPTMMVHVCYDGTSMQCQNCTSGTLAGSGLGSTGIGTSATGITRMRFDAIEASGSFGLCNNSHALVTVGTQGATAALPSAADTTCGNYFWLKIKDTGSGALTITPDSTDLIGEVNQATQSITGQGAGFECKAYSTTQWQCLELSALTKGTIRLEPRSASLNVGASTPAYVDCAETNCRLIYDNATSWTAQWELGLPQEFLGSLSIHLYYTMTSATTGSVHFDVALMNFATGSGDANTESFDTVTSCNDTAVPGTAGVMDQIDCNLSTIDSAAAGRKVKLKLTRDTANDDANSLAEVLYAELRYNRQ